VLMSSFAGEVERAMFLRYLAHWLAIQPADEIDRTALGQDFEQIKQLIHSMIQEHKGKPLPRVHRLSFRSLLAAHLRRDEDVLHRRAHRLGRLYSITAVGLGWGSFRGLGLCHPAGRFRNAGVFRRPCQFADTNATDLLWRMIRTKLQSYQFMGPGNGGRDIKAGLCYLALLYPLVIAAAKYSAAANERTTIDADDIAYAVGAIEHGFGRSALLRLPTVLRVEEQLQRHDVFARLVLTV